MIATVWAVLHDRDGDLAAGPFDSRTEAADYVGGFDDVYAAEVDAAWFERRNAELKARYA